MAVMCCLLFYSPDLCCASAASTAEHHTAKTQVFKLFGMPSQVLFWRDS